MKTTALTAAIVVLCSCFCAADSESVVREIEPWWETGSPEALAKTRRLTINPEKWSAEERRFRSLHVPPTGRFTGYGKVEILDLFCSADVFHFTRDESKFRGGFHVTYRIIEPAPVLLRASSGNGYWEFRNLDTWGSMAFYTGDEWNLSRKGVFEQQIPVERWTRPGSPRLTKGLHEFQKNKAFQVYDVNTGKWLGSCNRSSTPDYERTHLRGVPAILQDTAFTVADLRKYEIRIDEIISDWSNGGYVGSKVKTIDADGEVFDVQGADVQARITGSGPHEMSVIHLEPRLVFRSEGDARIFYGRIPDAFFEPQKIEVRANVRVLGPDCVFRTEQLTKTAERAASKAGSFEDWVGIAPMKEARTREGKLMETRFFGYCHLTEPQEKLLWYVKAVKKAHMNVIQVAVGGGMGGSYVPTDILPINKDAGTDFDGLAYIVEESHERDLEVHATIGCFFCGARGGPDAWHETSILKRHPDWAVRDADGNITMHRNKALADVHRPEYRRLMVEYLADIAGRYAIDGVTLDGIRTGKPCFCEKCRQEYAKKTGRDLAEDGKAHPFPLEYIEWHEAAISAFVKALRERLDGVRQGIRITAYVGYPPSIRMMNTQGCNSWDWLNNGWVDALLPMLYGGDPLEMARAWRDYASAVKRPELIWPAMGNYWRAQYVPDDYPRRDQLELVEKGLYCMPVEKLTPTYRMYYDRCHVRGIGIWSIRYATDKHVANISEQLFPEPAVPWWGD